MGQEYGKIQNEIKRELESLTLEPRLVLKEKLSR